MTMKKFIFLIVCVFVCGNAYGQEATIGSAMASSAFGWRNHSINPRGNAHFAAEAADLSISYYDPSAPIYGWAAPTNVGSFDIIGFTERITLPSDSGYIDSVTIVFDQISGDSVAIVLDPDTILLTPAGFDHLDATVFNTSLNSFGTAVIYPSQLSGSDTVTVVFPHIQVPQNFQVGLVPSVYTSGFTASYSIQGDTEATRVRTTDNCRSTFIGINTSTDHYESGVIDSNFMPVGYPSPLYSNLYITAFVSNLSSSVASNNASSVISVFPNPASTFLQIQGVIGTSNVELLDLLGRTVLSSEINGSDKLDVSQLQPGRYEAIIHSANGITSAPVLIQH